MRRSVSIHAPVDENDFLTGHLAGPTDDLKVEGNYGWPGNFNLLAMSTTSESSQGQFSFYHFDQASDFGIETENGERIKKKKRPGRKPNPPSAEKRRAQNRAAQKAYRQRHREKRENVEKTLEDYKKENEALKRKCAQTEFEANYLRAIVLQLTLTSLVQQGSVAHAWVSEDSELDMPSLLKMMLDRNKHIARLSKAFRALFQADSVLSCGKKFSKNMNSVAISRKQDILSEAIPSDNLENIPSGDSENISLDGSEGGATPHHDHSLILHKKPLKSVLTQPPSLQTADDFIHMSPLQALHISRIQLKFTSIMGTDMIASLKPSKSISLLLLTHSIAQLPYRESYLMISVSTIYPSAPSEIE